MDEQRIRNLITSLIEQKGLSDQDIKNIVNKAIELEHKKGNNLDRRYISLLIAHETRRARKKYIENMNNKGEIYGSILTFLISYIKDTLKTKSKKEILKNITLFCKSFVAIYKLQGIDESALELCVRTQIYFIELHKKREEKRLEKLKENDILL